MVARLVLVLGDQLSADLSALREADQANDIVVMAEVNDEATYVRHHPKKIALIFSAMRKFAITLQSAGWDVRYTQLDDTENAGSIIGEVLRRATETGASEVICTEPGEWRLINKLKHAPIKTHILNDDRFIASHAEFESWAEGRKALRMEYFYRDMRRKTGLMMEGGKPAGDKWNYDHDNRKPAPGEITSEGPLKFTPDVVVEDVLELVAARFGDNFGDVRPFHFATTREEALQALDHFVAQALPRFGDYQDAMLEGEAFLYHAVLSPYINLGLLAPLEVCQAVEAAWKKGNVPINAAEGFIRQIIGWREYVRGIYFLEGPDYAARNGLGHTRDLPAFFWGAETRMNCISKAVAQTREHAYAHHIQRLMVTGNFALLAGVDPHQVHEWYLEVYADAYEWVEAPNVVGMSQFADGGIIASKPYVSSGAYINRMSDYCKGCHYSVSKKVGEGACPFNLLYWHFLDRHRARFENNPRMGNMYRTWDRMDKERRETVLKDAETWLARLEAKESV
ncbi:cryptochrome/photolyase family protein [Sulfitobacter sp. TSTF-M16]|uniref:Cryptochrome/photolyase family protein n=1 Tax=Sulfitobacter aestuariivivens TaxID=2766981 RepID=A0A927DAU1_9RHOB|nr:cryptochrome/photolyase family protein [Sulfitobacter aestuariivivens]MBD3665851.1 cryptochrome/photolyase family protein [Sulfitobacter aestuariivivens]